MHISPLYYATYAAAYVRGEAYRSNCVLPSALMQKSLEALSGEEIEQILLAGKAARLKLYRFKNTHDDLPRIKCVLGFLKSITMNSLLDVGSGRGVFLWPCLNQFPQLAVTAIDLLPHRVDGLNTVRQGGVANLHAVVGDICHFESADKSYDVVTLLEVLEHVPEPVAVIKAAVRLAKKYIVLSVPSKPDDNPEHIHWLTKAQLTTFFNQAEITRLHFDYVPGHLVMTATLGDEHSLWN